MTNFKEYFYKNLNEGSKLKMSLEEYKSKVKKRIE